MKAHAAECVAFAKAITEGAPSRFPPNNRATWALFWAAFINRQPKTAKFASINSQRINQKAARNIAFRAAFCFRH
jgi:hypothetical protein